MVTRDRGRLVVESVWSLRLDCRWKGGEEGREAWGAMDGVGYEDEFDYEFTIKKIQQDERKLAKLKADIVTATALRDEADQLHKKVRIPSTFVSAPVETIASLSDTVHRQHHDFALYMAAKMSDVDAVKHALVDGKRLEFVNDQLRNVQRPQTYAVNWYPFETTKHAAIHAACGSQEIVAVLVQHGRSLLLQDVEQKTAEDHAHQEELFAMSAWLKELRIEQEKEFEELYVKRRVAQIDDILHQYPMNVFDCTTVTLKRLLSYLKDLRQYKRQIYRDVWYRHERDDKAKPCTSLSKLRKVVEKELSLRKAASKVTHVLPL